ncbi:MAG: hypothetical protein M3R38_03740 [Actinomycetota bacterium]|nr:hypothetical protein [Actinomycetota bacterium]
MSDEIDVFVERRARAVPEDRPGQEAANALAEMWAESDRRFQVRRRLELNAEWYRYHAHLCEHFGRLSREHGEMAEKLLEEDERGERNGA